MNNLAANLQRRLRSAYQAAYDWRQAGFHDLERLYLDQAAKLLEDLRRIERISNR